MCEAIDQFGKRSRHRIAAGLLLRLLLVCCLTFGSNSACHNLSAQDFEREPIRYATARTDNAVSQLQDQINHGTIQLDFEKRLGYLPSLLRSLNIPISSQTLVYSKTSMQRERISPQTPRAIYFNDQTYVGFCQNGNALELSTVDPQLGAVFYTLNQESVPSPSFVRQTDNCLSCHGSTSTRGVPGNLIRSVYADRTGLPVLSMGTHRIDHSSPIEHRWGGWYVTGTHGQQSHRGNLIVSGNHQQEPVDNSAGQNVQSLEGRFETSNYLSSHSDLIALMVLEHQVEGQNLLTRANFQTREAQHFEQQLNRELGERNDHRWDSTNSRIRNACESLVRYLLFSDEAKLTEPLRGTCVFEVEFANRGPRDVQGRSLRDFDLARRLFRYPCSYLIYSRQFDELPAEAKEIVLRRIWEVVSGTDSSREFAHLSSTDRQAILEIVRATKSGLPDYWLSDSATPDR